jgi:Uncharacterized protein containing a von Willebrand factor type A (vWA) domain
MKTKLALLLATALAHGTFAADTLRLKLEPDRDMVLKGSAQEVVIKIDLEAASKMKKTRRTPLNIAVVLDRSGSMTGAKLEKAKQAAALVVDRMAQDDIFSLVTYSDSSQVLVSAQRVEDKERLRRKIS